METTKIINLYNNSKIDSISGVNLHPTLDLDEMIREHFMQKTRNRIHYKVFEYLYKMS